MTGERETTPDELSEEFASTFKEWHYLVGGGAAGFALGFLVAVYAVILLFRAERGSRNARRGREPRGRDGGRWV
jgi:hypothetical protein